MYNLDLLDEPFGGDDLEWKVQTCGIGNNGKPWALIVPYVANRAIMNRLDKAVGKLNWKNEFKDLGNGAVECGIGIRCPETEEWIWKWDVGEEVDVANNSDSSMRVKSGRSNSMKRAAVQWGMGRHLYNIGETWAECTTDRQNGKNWTRAKTKDKKEFYWRVPTGNSNSQEVQPQLISPDQVQRIRSFVQANGITLQEAKMITKGKPADQILATDFDSVWSQLNELATKKNAKEPSVINKAQLDRLFAIANEYNVTDEQQAAIVKHRFGFESRKLITVDKYDEIVEAYRSVNQPMIVDSLPLETN